MIASARYGSPEEAISNWRSLSKSTQTRNFSRQLTGASSDGAESIAPDPLAFESGA